MNKSSLEHRMLDPSCFVPATSKDFPAGTIVLQSEYLTLPKDSKYGIPGIFQLPVDEKLLHSPSYNLVAKGISFAGHEIVRCIIIPTSDITTIPCNLDDSDNINEGRFSIEKTRYILNSFKGDSSTTRSGFFTSIKLGLVLRSARDLTQRFQIDGAVLLDPKLSSRFPFEGRPICLLGMDFITKYPYLLYVPRPDSSGAMDFMIARDPFASRSYSVNEQFYKTVIVHVDGHHDKDTGKIGCGIFFKSGSVFNMLSGVSKYDSSGNKHVAKLKERGILMAIIKALHVVRNFPVGRDFRGVIIRSTDPTIARLMAVTQVTMKSVFTDSKKNGEDGFDPMEGGYYYPTANRDLMLYFCHTFLQKELGFKVTFEDSENCGEARAANILAIAASQMEEFCIAKANGLIDKGLSFLQGQLREKNKAACPDITFLKNRVILEESSLYICLGLDGYFNIQQKKAHEVMEAADLVGVNHEVAAHRSLDVLSSESPGFSSKGTDSKKKIEMDMNTVDKRRVLVKKTDATASTKQIIENIFDKGLGSHKGEIYRDSRIPMRGIDAGLAFFKPELGYHHEIQIDGPVFKRTEKKIYREAKTQISKAKKEGQYNYESAEEQMVTRISQINDEDLEKHKNITKETNAKLTATRVEFNRKRELIVSETRTKIEIIKSEVSRSLELAGWKALEENGRRDRAISKRKVTGVVNGKTRKFQPPVTDYYSESE